MRVINRLNEIHAINKYAKYINNKLIPGLNKRLHLDFDPLISSDPYTSKFSSPMNEDGELFNITIVFTTNKKDLDGKFWGRFIIVGRTAEIGSLTGELDYDLDIIEDAYYTFYEEMVDKGVTLPGRR